MTSTRNPLGDLVLTPHQQGLLYAALNSNRPGNLPTNSGLQPQFTASPVLAADGMESFQASPDLNYDYDFAGADSSFDFSFEDINQPKMIGDLPGAKQPARSDSADNESPEKRSYPDDGEDSGAKRRESEEKVAKKPGRKPLTTEPSSKRKAQNRAAQRAFRERKEKHLKDLENKVQELEKLSEAANNENAALRAQIDRMTTELNEYRKRLSLLSNIRPAPQGPATPFGNFFVNNLNDVNFQFEFPKFGSLVRPLTASTNKPASPTTQQSPDDRSSSEQSQSGISPSNTGSYNPKAPETQTKSDLSSATDLFTSPVSNGNSVNGSSVSHDSPYHTGTATSSPSASSNSNTGGPSSSCGTSPEPFTQSPMGFKPLDTLATIGEEQPTLSNPAQGHFANVGTEDFTQWLPEPDFQFNPQVFGGYRDPQENGLSLGFDDSFFNDALDMDFPTAYNLPLTSPTAPKKDLIAQIDAAKNGDDTALSGQMLNCNKIWEKLQKCPKVQNGDFDLDGLCADLQKKAKCGGTAPVVDEKDFHLVMKKYLCKESQETSSTTTSAKTNNEATTAEQP
ncbi:hypothetical protein VTK26DRAFT_4920 [Humicola hyalothermophila]